MDSRSRSRDLERLVGRYADGFNWKMASATDDENKCKILIIGAGMAGLSAASHLVKNNMTDFKVLEARKRIGGRIISIEVDQHKVELGANWIHGVLGNPMYEIAMSNGLIDIVNIPKPHKVVAATEDGKQVPFKLLQEIYEAYMCFLHRCEEYFLCQYEPPAGISSVGEHIALEVAIYLERIPDPEDRKIRRLIFECLLKRETCISGCSTMSEIDLLELGSYTELQGGNIVLPSGYSSILGPVSRNIPPNLVLIDHTVKTINWMNDVSKNGNSGNDSGISDPGNDSDDSDKTVTEDVPPVHRKKSKDVSLDCGSKNCDSDKKSDDSFDNSNTSDNTLKSTSNVEVICENGVKIYADHVICTIPLGVLKERGSSLFFPPLPDYKMDSINKLLFGTVDKIFLAYDRPFLNPDVTEVMLLWNTDSESSFKDDLSRTWFKKIYSFSKVTETLLLGWVSGREAEYMESLPQQQVADTCTQILRTFLNDPFVPKPKLCVRTKWSHEPNTRGSYTAVAVGASQTDIENIARPLYASPHQTKPVVTFAGEHTHSSFYSTVHGAYLTGRSAAQILLAPDSPGPELVVQCSDTTDLSSWIQGISLN